MDLKIITKIFVIESPSTADLQVNRKEGLALSEMLTLAGIQNAYTLVYDLSEFSATLTTIAAEVKTDQKKWGAITLHFSFHGNEDGFFLSNDEFIDWAHFYKIIKVFNDTLGYIQYGYMPKFVPINLHFSSCEGFSAIKIKNMGEESPYLALLGPTEEVDWADSLMAFAVYYHNVIHKGRKGKEAIKIMNEVNNFIDVFKIDTMHFMEML